MSLKQSNKSKSTPGNGFKRKKSIEEIFGFDYDSARDTRNVRHKGKHGYNTKELVRIQYIKDKKDLQREERTKSSLEKFKHNINM